MATSSNLNRRTLMKRTAAAGLLAVPGLGALSACAGGGSDSKKTERVEPTEGNPLGVAPNSDIKVVIFDGGYGDQYALDAEKIYEKSYGSVSHSKTQEIQSRMQPLIAAGDPPDVINNSGAEAMDIAALIRDEKVFDLNELLDSPSFDNPNVPVRDTLIPGTVEKGQFGGQEVYQLNYAFTVYGQWYSRTALERLDVEYPRTWDEMIAVCEKAKKEGIAGWTYAGRHPYYLAFTLYPFIAKIGGPDVIKAIDNLEPNAWKHDSVRAAFEAYHELAAKGYILQGTPGMNHEESQDEWNEYNALFLPNGSWVENESKANTPDDFDMAVGPPTSLDSSDAMPFETMYAAAGEPFLVTADGNNVAGGLEFLRIMLANESGRNFTELVSSLSCVQGAADDLTLPPGLTSARDALEAAGDNVISPRIPDWYRELNNEDIGGAVAAMMSAEIDPAEAIDRCQKAADRTAKDDSVEKFKHA